MMLVGEVLLDERRELRVHGDLRQVAQVERVRRAQSHRDVSRRRPALLDEDLAEPLAQQWLELERLVDMLLGGGAVAHEQVAETQGRGLAGDRGSFHTGPYRREGPKASPRRRGSLTAWWQDPARERGPGARARRPVGRVRGRSGGRSWPEARDHRQRQCVLLAARRLLSRPRTAPCEGSARPPELGRQARRGDAQAG